MPDRPQTERRHFILRDTSRVIPFKSPPRGGKSSPVPLLQRQQHGASLLRQIEGLKPIAENAVRTQQKLQLESGFGLQVQFESQPDVVLAFESLAYEPKGIELLSVGDKDKQMFANVFIPDGDFTRFERYIAEYLQEKKGKDDRLLDHQRLLDAIQSIRAAGIKALWTDDESLLPTDPACQFWWEAWLPVRKQRDRVVGDFRKIARQAECEVHDGQVDFPDRTVLLMYGSQQQFSTSAMMLNCVSELRRAKETADFFDGMEVDEQRQWADEFLGRVQMPSPDDAVPHVCLLDSGVTRGHPLLAPLIASADLHTVDPIWGVDDQENHGTGQAGLAAYGDLTDALSSANSVNIPHRLESVKLIPGNGANQGNAQHHAYLFKEAVARPEISAPNRLRIFTSAVTADDYRDQGRPSSWSAAIDALAAGTDGDGEQIRLFILSAGNTRNPDAWKAYPGSLSTNLVHDPGQAWNAVTVGAYTEKTTTQAHNWTPIAPAGGLSPFSTTTCTWEQAWPLKPDVVLEGGNAAQDNFGAATMSSLSLLTTNSKPLNRLFTTSNATSAASALCARMAARIMAAYPGLRPETIRALLVHSAQWSDTMCSMYLPTGKPKKDDYVNLIRNCGWGIPDLERALWSAKDSLTLLIEDQVHPYAKIQGKGIVTRDMNLHTLPWPKEELEALQDTPVKMRVTLSYFIEPNPSSRGEASKYHYPSHRLRFDVQRPLDASVGDFIARVNAAAKREDDSDPGNSSDSNWLLGTMLRHRGSLHQDIWEGTAAELASRGFIAVYPVNGWWRTRPALERYALPARYSLVVSIQTQQAELDLYAAVAAKIPVLQEVMVGV